jgi:acetyl-CoA acyltransferase
MARRAVIVSGSRTPFVRAFGSFIRLDAIGLGAAAVKGLLDQTELPWSEIDAIRWGGVILPNGAPNVGREIALDLGLPHSVEAFTVTRACASGMQAVTLAAAAIERGEHDVIIAGGSDSTSNAALQLPASFVHKVAPVAMSSKSGALDYFKLLGKISPLKDLIPRKPEIAERSTGEVMGEAAERMAERNGVTREEQDAFAAMSHHRAAAAIASGRFDGEVVPVELGGKKIYADEIVRGDTSVEKLARLRPVFKKDGTLTAGNSSSLTDGAAAVLLMEESKARALGYTPLAAFRSWSYMAVDPADQLLMGPALAMPDALARAGMTLQDVSFMDMHEAFAAQVLSVLKMLASDAFAKERLGRDKAVGEVDMAKLNLHGGSVSLGHPFGATGARMITTVANELHSTGAETAVLGICAAGGLGAGAVMEAV